MLIHLLRWLCDQYQTFACFQKTFWWNW